MIHTSNIFRTYISLSFRTFWNPQSNRINLQSSTLQTNINATLPPDHRRRTNASWRRPSAAASRPWPAPWSSRPSLRRTTSPKSCWAARRTRPAPWYQTACACQWSAATSSPTPWTCQGARAARSARRSSGARSRSPSASSRGSTSRWASRACFHLTFRVWGGWSWRDYMAFSCGIVMNLIT